MAEERVSFGEWREYIASVRLRSQSHFRAHVRDQVAVSLIVTVLTGCFAWLLGAELASLLYAIGAFGVYMFCAAVFYRSEAHADMYLEAQNKLESVRVNARHMRQELAELEEVRFDVEAQQPEFTGRNRTHGDAHGFWYETCLFLNVKNENGPSARFSIHYSDVRGVERLDKKPYAPSANWHALAWEDYPNRTIEIGFHTNERVFVASCFVDPPKSFWFEIPESASWGGVGHGKHAASPPMVATDVVTFELKVVNHSENKEIFKRVNVEFEDNGRVRAFWLSEL